MKNISILATALIAMLGFSGCSFNGFGSSANTPAQEVVIQKVDKDDIREVMKQEKMIYTAPESANATFSAVGEGIAPLNTVSPAQALALAKRAAMADAYRNLAAKLYGVKINSKDTVKDAMLKNSSITSQVDGLVKNAAVTNEYFQNGLYKVELELEMNQEKWQEVFAY
ncbi:LPP20 family lipoprotein [Campylobacter sp. RM12327]|uniref:Putative lipoprotein n=1 Tax=Campylobacter sputorum subsp. sputorum TaxID=32024 RepID=A0A381DJW1_9BACT|nr:LPP20 family lipoprotein [Campylobacter sputorum aubsp. sputorum RM3237]ASM37492.1 LPP20 family lipoprotein [Campylobacter sputorum bv. faecalis CCUG 20703]ASM40737.1 LPP20 family lipoprotein [Campylobacter sputorum]KAB0581496.1 lipoprotein required for motility [Campylobacter sputorum subsp. sputorum]MBE7357962.1 LPP20 family lipoprotein [Campylobacter sp. RM11302]MBF6669636.1 LPP20 family lipoprotein [Campylobacter sp. RM12327]MBF6674892.1 LPP20 family lipoprotein [Campylobacter sp. RM13